MQCYSARAQTGSLWVLQETDTLSLTLNPARKLQMRQLFVCVNVHSAVFLLYFLPLFVSLAFICHHNSFLIYGSLQQPTLANWSRVTHVSVGSALIISATFAVAGYTTFTGYTQGRRIGLHCPKFVFVIKQICLFMVSYFPFFRRHIRELLQKW